MRSATGRLVFHIFAALAEFERRLIIVNILIHNGFFVCHLESQPRIPIRFSHLKPLYVESTLFTWLYIISGIGTWVK